MNTPFPSRFAFATAIVSREVPARPAAAKGLSVRVALLGLSVFALAAAALVAG